MMTDLTDEQTEALEFLRDFETSGERMACLAGYAGVSAGGANGLCRGDAGGRLPCGGGMTPA